MTPSELADRLEALESRGHMNTMDTEMFLNRETVLKSLRFAADMEVLMPRDPEFLISAKTSQVRLSVLDAGERIYFIGTDYYAAARKAVEALEEKR